MERLIGLTIGAIPRGFGQAGDDLIPRVIVGGGIGDECGHGQVSTIGKGDNADVVSRGGDAVLSAAGAGLVRDHSPAGNSPLSRFAPGMASVISFNNKPWLSAESFLFDCKAARSASAPLGVAQFRYCVSQSRPISFS